MHQAEPRQAGTIESYGERGVWVPEGMTARDIMEGARVLEREFEIAPYVSRAMAIAVLGAGKQTHGIG